MYIPVYIFRGAIRCGQKKHGECGDMRYTVSMNQDISPAPPQSVSEQVEREATAHPHAFLRRSFFVVMIIFFVVVIVFLVYQNGKSIYDNGI